jgi:hypothetical protein
VGKKAQNQTRKSFASPKKASCELQTNVKLKADLHRFTLERMQVASSSQKGWQRPWPLRAPTPVDMFLKLNHTC